MQNQTTLSEILSGYTTSIATTNTLPLLDTNGRITNLHRVIDDFREMHKKSSSKVIKIVIQMTLDDIYEKCIPDFHKAMDAISKDVRKQETALNTEVEKHNILTDASVARQKILNKKYSSGIIDRNEYEEKFNLISKEIQDRKQSLIEEHKRLDQKANDAYNKTTETFVNSPSFEAHTTCIATQITKWQTEFQSLLHAHSLYEHEKRLDKADRIV